MISENNNFFFHGNEALGEVEGRSGDFLLRIFLERLL